MLNIEALDLKLKLLSGEPIEIDKGAGKIKPLTTREIISYGYSNYLMRLHFISMDEERLLGGEKIDESLGINIFDLMVHYGNDDIHSELESAIGLFFKNPNVVIDKENHTIVIGDSDDFKIIDRDNFEKVREVIKWQNCIEKIEDDILDDDDEEDEAVKKIKERMAKSREMVKEAKKEDESDEVQIDLCDILSAVSSKSNSLNKLNVFDLTLYQLYDELKRLELIDQYNIAIKSLLAGAKDIDIKHWSNKLDW
jgi:hypothetical protein